MHIMLRFGEICQRIKHRKHQMKSCESEIVRIFIENPIVSK
jgi:hypothetical protein